MKTCTLCPLHLSCTNHVWAEGPSESQTQAETQAEIRVQASIFVLGEAPGASEDATGRPFMGQSGQLLRRTMVQAGLDPASCTITNVVRCRPQANRNPIADEIAACRVHLLEELVTAKPAFILACGSVAAKALGLRGSISSLRGRWHETEHGRVMPTFHPAFVLQSRRHIQELFADVVAVVKARKAFIHV